MDATSAWHAVKNIDGGTTNDYATDSGSALSMPSEYATTPAYPPVTWDTALTYGAPGFSSGGTELTARSWTFTITNDIGQIPNMGGGATKYAIAQKGGFYAGDLDMELSIVVPVTTFEWVRQRLVQDDGAALDITTVIDGVQVRWGSCRLKMDQSPMTSTAGYDETLVFQVGTFKYSGALNQSMGAPPSDGGERGAGTDLDVETGLPSGDEERRGRWPRWSPTTTPTWTRATPSPTRAPTP